MKSKNYFPLTIFLTCSLQSFAATVTLKSGLQVDGSILEETGKYIKTDVNGVPMTFYKDEISGIQREVDLSQPAVAKNKSPDAVTKEAGPGVVIVHAFREKGRGLGTGFVVSRNGAVATNFHVVVGAREIRVELRDGRIVPVDGIVAFDAVRDVCILKISAAHLAPLTLGDSEALSPGEDVVLIGVPGGTRFVVATGGFSGRRNFCGLKHLLFTITIFPGNSGGPLLDMAGEVVGIATFKRAGATGYSFAIPINEVKALVGDDVTLSVAAFNAGISRAYRLFHDGQEKFLNGNVEASIGILEESVQADPTYLEAALALGEAYMAAGRYEESRKIWEKIAAADPDSVEGYINLGIVYVHGGEYDLGVQALQTAVKLDPLRVEAQDNLGAAYARTKRYSLAVEAHQQAIRINPQYAVAYYNLAAAYYNLGQYPLAVANCDRALKLGYAVPEEFLEMVKPYR